MWPSGSSCSNRPRLRVAGGTLWRVVFVACVLMMLRATPSADAAPGINLSWDECGAAGSEVKTFACNQNNGAPFTLVASFVPPSNINEMVGLSADLRIASAVLPDWWKHGKGQCQGLNSLSTDFDFTVPGACTDYMYGRGVGGYLYEVGGFGGNTARLRVQSAIPYDEKGPLSSSTEYYAFKVQVQPSRVTGNGTCVGCDVPVSINLREIQLFQPLEANNDPVLLTPLMRATAFWQAKTGSVPTITAFTPASGTAGTIVTITGANLASATAVTFGNLAAEFTVVSGNELRATVPALARNGSRIIVDTPFGTATSATSFGLAPVVLAFVPEQAPVGSTVAIRGRHFEGTSLVRFNNVATTFQFVSDSTLRAIVPVGATTGPVSVLNDAGTGTSPASFRVGEAAGGLNLSWDDCGAAGTATKSFACNTNGQTAFTLIGSFVPPPGVTRLIGMTADLMLSAGTLPDWWKHGVDQCRGSTGLTVSSDFRTGPATCADPWKGRAGGPFAYETDFYGAQTARIRVTTGMSEVNAQAVDSFREYNGFKVSVLPTRVTGSPACSGCETPVSLTLNQIQLMQVAAAAYDPIITAPLVRNTANWQGTPGPRPRIDAFTPVAGGSGTLVTVTGINFDGVTAVRFGGSVAAFTTVSGTELHATLPADARSGAITVQSPYGTGTSSSPFIVAPVIASFTPAQGSVGTSVQINGSNFTGATSVRFNGTTASFVLDSNDLITAVVPEGATSGPVTVVNPGGTAASTAGFTVTLPAPRVDAFSPRGGRPGAVITVTGAHFTGATAVLLGGVAATHEVVSDVTIRVMVPAGARTGMVFVSNPGGTNATSPILVVAPVIESFTPSAGPPGTMVAIHGYNLDFAGAVSFGGPGATFSSQSATLIHATVPAGAVTGSISVANIGGTASSASVFTVQTPQPPVITSFAPPQAAIGASVIITGSHLSTVTAVRFGGTAAPFTVNSATQITATVPGSAQDGFITAQSPSGTGTSATMFLVLGGDSNPGSINLSWDDCGIAGTRTKDFACNASAGAPFTLVGSFDPPSGVTDFLGISADLTIATEQALPDWWKHGTGFCRTTTGLSINFDFTGGPSTCVDVFGGAAAGGFAYDVGYGAPNRARLRIQAAIPVDNKGPVDPGSEYYAFKINLLRAKTTGTGACSGCEMPAVITFNSIQLFQPLENNFDPMLTSPRDNNVVRWQNTSPNAPRITTFAPAIGPAGTLVTIDGANFAGASRVAFNGVASQFTVESSMRIRATVPNGARTGAINIVTPLGSAFSALAFEVPNSVVGGGINLSWDDCGTAGTRTKLFACDTNAGFPSTLVASFEPPAGVDQFLGVSADLTITSEAALPDWWKHGSGFCRGTTALATSFDFTSGPSTCVDFSSGLAAGGYAYDVAFGASNRARLRVQYAVPYDNRGPVAPGTEYYAFKVNLMNSKSSGTGSCAGCNVPVAIGLNSIQLFQPLEFNFDPTITTPLNSAVAYWQSEGGTQLPPAIGPNLVTNPSFESSLAGWGGLINTVVERIADAHEGSYALRAVSPDSVAEFGVNDSPNWIVAAPDSGSRYRLSAWIKSPTPGFSAQLRIREFLLRTRTQTVGSAWIYPTSEWQYVEFEASALAAGATLDFQIVTRLAAPRSQLLIDDVSIRMVGSGPFMDAARERAVDPGTPIEIVVTASDTTGKAVRSLVADLSELPTGHDATFTVDPGNRRGVLRWTPQLEDGGAIYAVTFRGRSMLQNSVTTRITVRPAQDGGNLVSDPSFESQYLWLWKPYQGATTSASSPGRTGNIALQVLGRADSASVFGINDGPNMVSSTGPNAGRRYRFTCWVRGDSAAGFARLRVREYLGVAKVGATIFSNDVPLTSSWRKLIVEHVSGAAGSTLDFQVLAESVRPGVTFFVDDVSIRAVAAPPAATPLAARESATLTFERPSVMPNPFRGHASLALTVSRRGPLKIALYDVNGRRVRNVHEHIDAAAGTHRFDLDGKNDRGERLGPGVFFYRIDSADGMRQGRFVVLEQRGPPPRSCTS